LEKFRIVGGNRLDGKIKVGGAKNAAVGMLPAALLAEGTCVIDNIPEIADVLGMIELIKELGCNVKFSKGRAEINNVKTFRHSASYEGVNKMRASYYLIGVLLAKFGEAEVAFPGGCEIGLRPIDQHIKGFQALGATVDIQHGVIKVRADKLVGNEIYMDVVSVGATINVMIAATKAEGVTTIVNAAKEPHIVDIANFLNCMGANVKGAGTDVIRIIGVEKLTGCEYTVIPDQIEAGTYMMAAAATGGDVTLLDVIPKHLEATTAKLLEMHITVEEGVDWIRVIGNNRPERVDIKTQPYPGFPTDMQQPASVLMCIANGTSILTENIWESRFKHLEEMTKMGAKVKIEDRIAVIEGVEKLTGARVEASDLRAGAALVIAGLIAEGVTEVSNVQYIDRGYELLEYKLTQLGADIHRVDAKGRVKRIKRAK
jgi:UDP-N-acetylglucosamine 1-carboxyvinyltransferase